jgi:plastocyanin
MMSFRQLAGSSICLAFVFGFFRAGVVTADPQTEPPKTPTVEIKNFAFVPAVLTVTVGETVTWTNMDDDPHAVVASDKSFRSHVLDTGEKDSHVFTKPGEYGYFCSLHPHMTATIIVKTP